MDEEPAAKKDPFVTVEELMADARHKIAHQVARWQKAHQITDCGYQLVRQFNEDRKQLGASGELNNYYMTFANVSGLTFCNLATDLQNPEDPTLTAGTSQVLLSGLQSNVASFVSSINFDVKKPFVQTLTILKAQHVPLETRLAALSRRIGKFSDHFSGMIRGVEEDLLNQTNPLSMSNAAKNLRELLTAFIHNVAPDGTIEGWLDCKVDEKKRPTRGSRLKFHAFLGIPKAHWPKMWAQQVKKRVRNVLDCFDHLNKYTHINDATIDELQTARVILDKFVNEFLLYLDTAGEGNDVLLGLLQPGVEKELQQLVEVDLHSWFEKGVTHAYTDAVDCEELRVDEKNGDKIVFSGCCRVTGTFQMGSNSDVRHGDGAVWKDSKRFAFCGTASTANLDEVEISPVDLR